MIKSSDLQNKGTPTKDPVLNKALESRCKKAVDDLIKAAGSAAALARELKMNYHRVYQWQVQPSQVSRQGVEAVKHHPELSKQFPPHRLRPDLYDAQDRLITIYPPQQ